MQPFDPFLINPLIELIEILLYGALLLLNRINPIPYSLLCALLVLNMISQVNAADSKGIEIAVFDASAVTQWGGDNIWRLVLNHVAQKENWSVTYVSGKLSMGYAHLAEGKVDVLTAVPYRYLRGRPDSITNETVISTWSQLYTHSGSTIASLLDLHHQTVGVVQGDFNNHLSRDMLNGLDIELKLVDFKTGEEMLMALENKWIEAAILDRFFAASKIHDYDVVRTPIMFSPMEYRFAAPKNHIQDIGNVIDYHLRALKKDRESFYHRYMEDLFGEKEDLRFFKYVKWGLGVAVTCLLFITIHALVLRSRVNARTAELAQKNEELEEALSKRERAEQQRRTSEEKYRLLVENAHDPIIVVQDGELKFANPAAYSAFGYDPFEAVSIFEIIHPEDRDAIANLNILNQENGSKAELHTFRAYTKDKSQRWVQMRGVRFDWNAKPAVFCIIRDITETKRMESQLAQGQKMQAIGTLAGGIAHDFNNILAIMLGYTELCKVEAGEGHEIQRKLDQIFKAGHRAKDLVNQILTFSYQKENNSNPTNVKYCLKEALKLLKATIPSNIVIKEDIQKAPGIVLADPTRIQQIIMNLCTNASYAMGEERGVLDICLKNVDLDRSVTGFNKKIEPGPYVWLKVADTGCGMTQATLQRIFEPYYTTKRQGEGTGLGLSVVHGIVEDLNGVIQVYSEPGTGTTFNIYFPRVDLDSEQPVRLTEKVTGGNETVLLVDDEKMVLDMTEMILSNLGYKVIAKTRSIEAFEAFQKNPDHFDLVLTDQTMPILTGRMLAQKIMHIRPKLPIILCTGFSANIDEEKALALGIRAFVQKPILRRELASVLRGALDGNQKKEKTAAFSETG